MKRSHQIAFFTAIILIVAATTLPAQPNWIVTPSDFQYTMTATCVAVFDCVESGDTNDMVAAFINGELRGVQRLETDYEGRKFAFMIVYDNEFSGNQITFKLYDASADTVLDALDSIVFAENGNAGDVDAPFRVRTDNAIDTILLSRDSIPEYAVAGDTAATITALDEQQNTLVMTWDFVQDSLGPDNHYFSITGNALVLNEAVNPAAMANYRIHLLGTTYGGCTSDWELLLPVAGPGATNLSGPDSDDTGRVVLFPNPAGHTLHLASTNPVDMLRIYDAGGRLVYVAGDLSVSHSLDVSGWTPQIYFVVCQTDKANYSQKLIVRH